MRARLPAGDYRSSLHVQYHHPSCRAAEFTPCSPAGQGGVRVTIARADTRTSTRIRRVMVLQQRSRRVQIDGCTYNMYFCHARLSCRNNAPGVAPSLPVFFPRPLLGFHTTRASLPPSSIMARAWQLGRQGCPFLPVPPSIMGNIGSAYSGGPTGQSHIPGRYFAWPLFASCLCAGRASSAILCILAPLEKIFPPPPDVVEGPASDNISM